MLTSSHYWFGGLFAVSCAIAALSHPPGTAANLPQVLSQEATSEAIDVSGRGSGRFGLALPTKRASLNLLPPQRGTVSHRGSGRIRPLYL